MKKTSSKLFLVAASLGLAAASTIGSTFAWFTVNGSAEVTNVQMTVAGGSGISIRKHGEEKYALAMDLKDDLDGKTWSPCTTNETDLKSKTFKKVNVPLTIENYKNENGGASFDKNSASNMETEYKLETILATDLFDEDKGGYVYTLDLDVRVSENNDFTIKVTVPDSGVEDAVKVTNGKNGNIDAKEVIRVGVINYDNATSTGAVTDAKIYRIADRSETNKTNLDAATTLFNNQYGVKIKSYADDQLDSTTGLPSLLNPEKCAKVVTSADNLEDGYYTERVAIAIWYEGTDWVCSNRIFSETVSFGLTIEPVAKAQQA